MNFCLDTCPHCLRLRQNLLVLPKPDILLFFHHSARWIGNHGFSIGIDDVQPGKLLSEQKTEKILIGYKECDTLIQSYNEGKLTLRSGCDASKTLEAEITTNLNRIREEAGEVMLFGLYMFTSMCVCLYIYTYAYVRYIMASTSSIDLVFMCTCMNLFRFNVQNLMRALVTYLTYLSIS